MATHENPIDIAHSWGLPNDVWDRAWSTLSGGEAQRVSLAIGIGIPGAEIVLLDGESQTPPGYQANIHLQSRPLPLMRRQRRQSKRL